MNEPLSGQKTALEPHLSGSNQRATPVVPDHELLRRIGQGGYGEVWLARNVIGTYRAVKVVYRSTFSNDRPYEREFGGIQKYEPISGSHDGLVDILHVGRNDQAGHFYYVMELADDAKVGRASSLPVPGASLPRVPSLAPHAIGGKLPAPQFTADSYLPKTLAKELFARGRLPIEECLQLSLSLTAALGHLHKNGLVHRDIKPSNIIFVEGVPKLADIGLVTDTGEARTFVGTEGFIPPEGPGTPQADIYSLGKVLYQICTGKDRHDYPELPSDLDEMEGRAELLRFTEIVAKACDPDLPRRYQTTAQMLEDLLTLQRGEPISPLAAADRLKLPRYLVTLAGHRRGIVAVAAALLLPVALLPLIRTTTKNRATTPILPPAVAALPAAGVLKVAYGGTPPPAASQAVKPQLQFEILAKRAGETTFNPLRDGDTLRSEIDDYLILACPLSAGWLYVFPVDSLGQKEWLFPQNAASKFSSGSNPVGAGQIVQLPSAEKERVFFLDKMTGIEHTYAVFSITRWQELEEALTKPAFIDRSRGDLMTRRVEEPNGLRLRGVGGVRTNASAINLNEALERIHGGQTNQLNLSSPTSEASGSFLALERWFKHINSQ